MFACFLHAGALGVEEELQLKLSLWLSAQPTQSPPPHTQTHTHTHTHTHNARTRSGGQVHSLDPQVVVPKVWQRVCHQGL